MLSPQLAKTMIGERIEAQIERLAVVDARLAARQPVADEELLDDPADLGFVQEMEAAPPALELEEPLALALRVGEQVVILAQIVAARIEQLEIGDEMGAVELAVPEIRQQQRRQRAAEQAAIVAHRILADAAGPVGERRAVDDERAR